MTKGAYRIALLVLGGSWLAAQAEEGFESVFNGTDLSGYGFAGPAERVSKQPGEWQTMAVRLEGQQLTIVLNGVAMVEADLDQIGSHAGFAPGPGRLGFQNYNGSEIQLRNIRIKTL